MPEIELSLQDVRALLALHAPEWGIKRIEKVASAGTDNALFRLDDNCLLRIPSRPSAVEPLRKELIWLPKFTGLSLSVPQVLLQSQTHNELGFDFGIYAWLDGEEAFPDRIDDLTQASKSLATFLTTLRKMPTDGAPLAGPHNNNRGIVLSELTDKTMTSIETLSDEINAEAARAIWEAACSNPFDAQPTWVHGDLKSDNMLAKGGRLSAVIDWGLSAVGDPAVDLATAWTWVTPENRAAFQNECNVSQTDWNRAKGWAVYCAVIALSYYRGRSHDALCKQSRQTLQNLGLLQS